MSDLKMEEEENDEDFEISLDDCLEFMHGFSSDGADFDILKNCFAALSVFRILFSADLGHIKNYNERNMALYPDGFTIREDFKRHSSIVIDVREKISTMNESLFPYTLNGETFTTLNEVNTILDEAMASIVSSKESILQLYRGKALSSPELKQCLPEPRMEMFLKPITTKEMKDHQLLIRFYIQECGSLCYRKKRSDPDNLYQPLYVDGHYTHHYKVAETVKEFIYRAIGPAECFPDRFNMLTKSGNTPAQAERYIQNSFERNLPFFEKCRTLFSYRNGIFDAKKNMFYPYVKTKGWPASSADLNRNQVSCNYIDQDFDFIKYNDFENPYEIPTPSIQKILDDQGLKGNEDVCRWAYFCLGRMIFALGHDNLQFCPMFKGTAGSGKSLLLRIMMLFFDTADVAILMSQGRPNFSLQHIHGKFIYVCLDSGEIDLKLQTWLQMVAAEEIMVDKLFEVSKKVLWDMPGAFAGNSYFPWIDKAGNVARRVLLFQFSNVITKVDTTLFDKCKAELPAFMAKCVAIYHIMMEDHIGERGIWDKGVLPEYFHKNRRHMQADTNPLQSFIEDSDFCILGQDQDCEFMKFKNIYKQYCDTNKLKLRSLKNTDFIMPVFHMNSIKFMKPPPSSDPLHWDGYKCKYLKGISIVQ